MKDSVDNNKDIIVAHTKEIKILPLVMVNINKNIRTKMLVHIPKSESKKA